MNFVQRVTAIDTCRGIGVLLAAYAVGSRLVEPGAVGADALPLVSSGNIPGYPLGSVSLALAVLLFMLGMSVPFGIHHMLERGWSKWFIVFRSIQRGVLLAAIAAGIGMFRSFSVLYGPGVLTSVYGAAMFGALYLLFVRFSMDTPIYQRQLFRTGAFIIIMLSGLTMYIAVEDLALFSRTEETLVMFADVALCSMVIWLYMRTNPVHLVGLLLLLLGVQLTHGVEGSWTASVWDAAPLPWLFRTVYLQYLFLTIPGMIAGGLMFDRKRSATPDTADTVGITPEALRKTLWIIPTIISTAVIAGTIVPLIYTLPVVWILLIMLERQVRTARRKDELMIRSLTRWGAFWLLLGQVFMPSDAAAVLWHVPMGYLFLSAGAMTLLFAWVSILSERYERNSFLAYLTACGSHPLAATSFVLLIVLPLFMAVMPSLRSVFPSAVDWFSPLSGIICALLAVMLSMWSGRRRISWRT